MRDCFASRVQITKWRVGHTRRAPRPSIRCTLAYLYGPLPTGWVLSGLGMLPAFKMFGRSWWLSEMAHMRAAIENDG